MNAAEDLGMLRTLVSYSPDLICALTAEGHFRCVSDACRWLLGYENDEMIGKHLSHILHPDDCSAALTKFREASAQTEPVGFESRCLGKDGQEVDVAWSARWAATDELLICVGRNVTQQQQAAQQDRDQEARNQTVVEHGFDMVGLVDADGVYTYTGGTNCRIMGRAPEELVGHSAFEFVHPDDLTGVRNSWNLLRSRPAVAIPDFRLRTCNGAWRWVEAIVTNSQAPAAVKSYTMSFRDITERKQSSLAQAESEQRFRLLFDNDATLAVFQDIDGVVLDINPALLSFLSKEKSEVLHQPLADFLPEEAREQFIGEHRKAARGQKVVFEIPVTITGQKEKILRITQTPLVVDDAIVGVHGTLQDITEIANAQCLIKQQDDRLNALLTSINDGFISLDKAWNLTYLNSQAEQLLGISQEGALGINLWTLFPEDADGPCRQHYQQAIDTGQTVGFEMYFKREQRWLEIKAYPFAGGLSIFFTDVTARVAAEKQLRLLALVARSTDNGVVITDAAGRTEWANDAFTRHTGYALAEVLGQRLDVLLQGPDTDPAAVRRIGERLAAQAPFSVTVLGRKKSGEKRWLAMDVTPARDGAGGVTQFVAVYRDVTFRKEVEASQAKMTQDLYRHNRDLQQFTYVISHNLRAPLANALGLATVLAKVDKAGAVFAATLGHLRRSMAQADAVLRDLNLVLSIRDKEHTGRQESVPLARVCAQALRDLDEPLQQCGGRVALAVDEGLAVLGERAYLYSIFYNLLSNAIKYRAPARPLRVDIACTRAPGGGARVRFTDNGSGFDMFKAGSDVFQLYKRFHTNQRGRGIGLFLVKTHVEALGGKIEVASEVDFGTRFTIQLDQPTPDQSQP